MIERIAADSNAVIEWLRSGSIEPPALRTVRRLILPLTVIGELYAGAFASARREENVAQVEAFVAKHTILHPDEKTARVYGELRARLQYDKVGRSKTNDLWIAALCIQHDLPLLSNDRGFDVIPTLTTIRW